MVLATSVIENFRSVGFGMAWFLPESTGSSCLFRPFDAFPTKRLSCKPKGFRVAAALNNFSNLC